MNADTLTALLEVACLTEDRTGDEQRAMPWPTPANPTGAPSPF